ncbi:MAG: DUF4388 domain-containing protein [Phormidesmis sp.]
MNLQGLTSEYSLPELFKFLQESQQTGRLAMKPVGDSTLDNKSYFFWFKKGKLLAASNRLDGLGLLQIMQSRSLISGATLPQLLRECPPKVALGKFLKDRAMLTGKQLNSLFAAQILRYMCALLKAKDVKFTFHASYPVPCLEMTGISIRATDVTLPSLRILKEWGALVNKLPSLTSGLKLVGEEPSTYRLQTQEKDVLRLAQDGLSLSKISNVLKLPELDVQKAGFRLIFVGLVKEAPLVHIAKFTPQPKRRITRLSESFLGRLSGFLKKIPAMAQAEREIPSTLNRAPVHSTFHSTFHSAFHTAFHSHQRTANLDKTARNSAVKRLANVLTTDRSERLPEAAYCLLTQYPSCLLTCSAVRA